MENKRKKKKNQDDEQSHYLQSINLILLHKGCDYLLHVLEIRNE